MYSKTESHSIKDFQIISKLGQGSFGQVFKVKYIPTSQTYALKKIKVFRITEKDRESALNQIRVLASCQHQNIIGYKGSFYDEASSSLCLVLQYAEQGDLARKIHKAKKQAKFIQQSQIWSALVQLTLGIYSLHENNIIHRDLKPANIFIMADGTYKIGDLNICKIMKKQLAKTQTGTPYYVSPQIWKGKSYGSKVDIWSLGCIIYQMASKVPPFLGNDVHQLKHKVLKGTFPRIPNHYSEQLSSLINSMLTQNPEFRPQPFQILINPVVIKKYKGQILLGQNKQKDKLLQTIKLNQRNWKKLNLPQSKYLKSQSTYNKQQLKNISQNDGSINKINKFDQDRMKMLSCQRPGSAKSGRKSVAQIEKEKNRNNIHNYLLKNNKQAQKIAEIKKLTQQLRIKQRAVSAYGERPRIQCQQGKYEQQNQSGKKQQLNRAPPLPAKAKVFSNRQNQVQKVNDPKLRPTNIAANKQQSSQTDRSSKQNLKQVGQRIIKSNSIYSQKQSEANQILKTVKKLKS